MAVSKKLFSIHKEKWNKQVEAIEWKFRQKNEEPIFEQLKMTGVLSILSIQNRSYSCIVPFWLVKDSLPFMNQHFFSLIE